MFFGKRTKPFSTIELVKQKYANFVFSKNKFNFFTYPKNENLIKFLFNLPKFKERKVLDPFAGTGISGIIVNNLGISCTLIQKSEKTKKNSKLWNIGIKDIFELTKKNLLEAKIKVKIFEK